jgi:diguanylate cyclase (GGDEF)-like protein
MTTQTFGSFNDYIHYHFDELTAITKKGTKSKKRQVNTGDFKHHFEHLSSCVFLIDHHGKIIYSNLAFDKLFSIHQEAVSIKDIDFFNTINLPYFKESQSFGWQMLPDKWFYFQSHLTIVPISSTYILQIILTDVTSLMVALTKSRHETRHYLTYLPLIHDPMFILDTNGVCLDILSRRSEFLGCSLFSFVGQNALEVLPIEYATSLINAIPLALSTRSYHFNSEHRLNLQILAYETHLHQLDSSTVLCHIRDISEVRTLVSSLEYLKDFDSLTDLYNRQYYEKKLTSLPEAINLPLGVFTLRLLGLKRANLEYGSTFGDHFIIEISLAIKSATTQHDIPCRISGDTFLIFLPNCSAHTLTKFENRLLHALEPYKKMEQEHAVSIATKHIIAHTFETPLNHLIKNMLY